MDRYKIERALGIIEGVAWIINDGATKDALINAAEMIDNAMQEPCCGEVAK